MDLDWLNPRRIRKCVHDYSFSHFSQCIIGLSIDEFSGNRGAAQQKHLTQEEQVCETFFANTVARNEDGRYVVRLPFKQRPSFKGTRVIATVCFLCTEKRWERNPKLAV